jgi:hypothetical protein
MCRSGPSGGVPEEFCVVFWVVCINESGLFPGHDGVVGVGSNVLVQ